MQSTISDTANGHHQSFFAKNLREESPLDDLPSNYISQAAHTVHIRSPPDSQAKNYGRGHPAPTCTAPTNCASSTVAAVDCTILSQLRSSPLVLAAARVCDISWWPISLVAAVSANRVPLPRITLRGDVLRFLVTTGKPNP